MNLQAGAISWEESQGGWVCGGCGQIPVACTCGAFGQQDYVIKELPTPSNQAPTYLINRWYSLVRSRPGLGKSLNWESEYEGGVKRALDNPRCRNTILRLVHSFLRPESLRADIATHLHLQIVKQIYYFLLIKQKQDGGHSTQQEENNVDDTVFQLLVHILESTAHAFLAGDWACISRLGIISLMNAFPARSEWSSHPLLKDPNMFDDINALFGAGMHLMNILEQGYSNTPAGFCLTMEDSFDGLCPPRWHGWFRDWITSGNAPPRDLLFRPTM